MNNLLRGLIAGYGAKKLGGGCFSTVVIFLLLFWALGMCGSTYAPVEASDAVERVEPAPALETTPPVETTPAVRLVPAG